MEELRERIRKLYDETEVIVLDVGEDDSEIEVEFRGEPPRTGDFPDFPADNDPNYVFEPTEEELEQIEEEVKRLLGAAYDFLPNISAPVETQYSVRVQRIRKQQGLQ